MSQCLFRQSLSCRNLEMKPPLGLLDVDALTVVRPKPGFLRGRWTRWWKNSPSATSREP